MPLVDCVAIAREAAHAVSVLAERPEKFEWLEATKAESG